MPKIHQTLWFRFLLLALLNAVASAQLVPSGDTYVTGASPTTANGSSTSLVVQGSSVGKPSYSFIRFDMIPLTGVNASQVQSAYLRVYVTAVTAAGGFNVYEVTAPTGWAEGTLTYSGGGSTATGTQLGGTIAVPYPSGKSQYFDIDVTQAVKDWITTPGTNNGLVLKPADNSVSISLSSKEDTTYSQVPNLVVQVTPGLGGTVTSVGTGAGLTGGPITTSGTISLVPPSSLALGGVKSPSGGVCPAGSHVSGIAIDGTLTCSADTQTTSLSFSGIITGTNIGQALSVGNGSSLSPSGTGHITADFFTGNISESQVTNLASDLSAEATARMAGDASTLSSAKSYTDAQVLSEALARAAGDTAAIASANTYTDTQVATINTSLTGKANKAGGNIFTGGSQVLAQSAMGYASLNIPVGGAAPTTIAKGDIWTVTVDPHLHFQDMTNATQMLAFMSDVNQANSTTLASANAYTDGQIAIEAAARIAGDASTLSSANAHADAGDVTTLSSANAHADAGDVTTLSSANTFTSNAVTAEAVLRAAGDAATLASANTYTDAEKTRALAAEALKANLASGNLFTGGKQTLADAAAGYASLNVPNSSTGPDNAHVAIGDLWLTTLDQHLNFRTMNNSTEMLAFFSDMTAANAGTLASANAYTDGQIATEAAARQAADTAETNARVAGDAATFSSANAHADAGDTATLSSANTFTSNAVTAEAVLRAAGDAATLASANTYTDAEKTRALAAEGLKANLAGGNLFTGGKQTLAGSTTTYASVNILNGAAAPDNAHVVSGDLWLTPADTHLQFRDNAGTPTTHSLMFTDDPVNGTNLSAGSVANSALANSSITVNAGSGLSGGGSVALGGSTTLSNTGVLSNIAGFGILVSGSTGNVTITNNGVLAVGVDGFGIINSGTAQNPALSIGAVAGGQILGDIAGNAHNVTGTVAVANGGTGLNNGTTGGVLGFTSSGTLASSSTLDVGGIVLGGGIGNTPSTSSDFTTNLNSGFHVATLNVGKSGNGFPLTGDIGALFLGGSTNGGPTLASQQNGGSLTLQLPNTAPSLNQVLTASAVSGNNITLGFANQNAGTVTNPGTLTSGQLIFGNGGSSVAAGNLTGDVITSGSSATTLAGSISGSHTFTGNVTFSNAITGSVSGSAASFSGSLAGDVTGTQGATTVAKINGSPLGTTSGAANGQVLAFNGAQWTPANVTASGFGAQNANAVLAGPTTGAAANPTFRGLVSADLPVATSGQFGAVRPTIVNAVTNNVNLKNTTLSFAVNCAAGRFVLGGGVNTDTTSHVTVAASYPSAAGTWSTALTGDASANSVSVTVYAICSGN